MPSTLQNVFSWFDHRGPMLRIMQHKIMICKFNQNDLFTQVLDFSYVQIIKVPGEGKGCLRGCNPRNPPLDPPVVSDYL